jgi:hypothetical protein
MIQPQPAQGNEPPAPALWFGKYKGLPPAQVPSDYLAWVLRTCKLTPGLRSTVTAELRSRGQSVPEPPPPKPLPICDRCGAREANLAWHELSGGRRQIRATCAACGGFVKFVAQTPENVALANAVQPSAGLLDALLQAEIDGVELVHRFGRVEPVPYHGASPRLRNLVRQSQHALLRHLLQRKAVPS